MPEVSPEELFEEISDWERRQREQIAQPKPTDEFSAAVQEWRKTHILTFKDLANLPPQTPLIHGNILFRRTTCWIAGLPGTYKSFVSLDWAMCIATGRPWLGRAVEKGRVLYIAGEGARGIYIRGSAWLSRAGLNEDVFDDAFYVMGPTNLLDPQTRVYLSHLAAEGYWDLVVIDTQARATPGVNENAKEELDPFINFITHLASDQGATVLTVHHATKSGSDSLRGSGSILGAADSVFVLRREEDTQLEVELKVEKQKETESGERIPLTLVEHRFAEGDEGASLVIDHGFSQEDLRAAGLGRKLGPEEAKSVEAELLALLEEVGDGVLTRHALVKEVRAIAERLHIRAEHRQLQNVIQVAILANLIELPQDGKAALTQVGTARLQWHRQFGYADEE